MYSDNKIQIKSFTDFESLNNFGNSFLYNSSKVFITSFCLNEIPKELINILSVKILTKINNNIQIILKNIFQRTLSTIFPES